MDKIFNLKIIAVLLLLLGLGYILFFSPIKTTQATKLYWFIPDGMRAEEDLFTVYKWAQEGKLPNIKKIMDEGAYGYSIPDFPSHTPTNFASLLTGAHPTVHGVADGPMHIEGKPLDKPSVAGFSSVAKKVSPIWKVMEEAGKKVVLLAIPGSTPPELKNGITIRGRWGGWGADTHAVIYEPKEMQAVRKSEGRGFRLFYLGQPLTQFVEKKALPDGKFEAKLAAYGASFDAIVSADSVAFSQSGNPLVTLKPGVFSEWFPVKLTVSEKSFDSQVRFRVIKLSQGGNFRIRVFFNNINSLIVDPGYVADEITQAIGPSVDFVDNWPPQLIYEDGDKQTFLDEAMDSLDWHKKAADFIFKKYKPDVFIQDTYTPNQMLESRWWHRFVDKENPDYDPKKADQAMSEILAMYQGLDSIIGEAIKNADKNTLIVLSSDHGIAGLHKQVRLNNLFAQKGWFKFKIDQKTGEPIIDWENSKVVYLKMAHVYINPKGLGGNWTRGSGPEYEKLRDEVTRALQEVTDTDGTKPLVQAVKWEDAPKFFELPTDRVGDLVLEVKKGYQWLEEPDQTLTIFTKPLTSGYKQANNPKDSDMWTPFVIMGPGVKKGARLDKPISHVDQMPTILELMSIKIPSYVQGRVLKEIIR